MKVLLKSNKQIANPPYSIGNKIISEAIKHLTDEGTAAVLMPRNLYAKIPVKDEEGKKILYYTELYKNTEDATIVPNMFDAVVQKDNLITTLKKHPTNKYKTYEDLVLSTWPERSRKVAEWCFNHKNSKISLNRADGVRLRNGILYKGKSTYKPEETFIEQDRCTKQSNGVGYFSKGSFAYEFNMTNTNLKDVSHAIAIFTQNKANFTKYAYNYKGDIDTETTCLSSIMLTDLMSDGFSGSFWFAIPQIDWEHISDKYPDYAKDPDKYVLMEMGLRWNNANKEKIVEL